MVKKLAIKNQKQEPITSCFKMNDNIILIIYNALRFQARGYFLAALPGPKPSKSWTSDNR